MRNSDYRPEIDGLRAVSVVSVVAYHYGLFCPGGFCGVDVFYVISGYLITGLIRQQLQVETFSFQDFWARRIRRLLPAMLVMVVSVWIAAMFVFLPADNKDLGKSLVAQSLLLSNVYFWRTNEYFGNASENKPLLHTWSLSLEEQFYLILPALLFLCGKSMQKTKKAVAIVFVSSVAFSVWWTAWRPIPAFYLLPSRMWELLLGSMLSIWEPGLRPRPASLGWLGMIFLAASFWGFSPSTPFPGIAAMLPCLGGVLVLASAKPGDSLHRLLTKNTMIFLGRISYSWYLWHWPVFVFLHYLTDGEPSLTQKVSGCGLSLLLGFASWRFVEHPWRRAESSENLPALKAGVATSILLILLGAITLWGDGFPGRFSSRVIALANAEADLEMMVSLDAAQVRSGQVTQLGIAKKRADFVVWGDSHAAAVAPGLSLAARKAGLAGRALTRSSTPPLTGYFDPCRQHSRLETLAFNQAALEYIKQRSIKQVILVSFWSQYSPQGMNDGFASTTRELLDSGCKVYIMLEVPQQKANVPRSLALDEHFSRTSHLWSAGLASYNRENQDFLNLLSTYPQVQIIDTRRDLFDKNGNSIVIINGRPVYRDSGHLSTSGSKWVSNFLAEQLGWTDTSGTPERP